MKIITDKTDIDNIFIQPSHVTILVAYVIVTLITISLFFITYNFEFINYDDVALLVNNINVNTGLSIDNLKWAFTSTDKFHWAPLTWVTHMIDFELYGEHASGHHITNLILHTLNTLLLLTFLYKATDKFWRSFIVAILFAIHPLHVEPVAWVTARKDVLSTFFCFITLLLYLNYTKQPSVKKYFLVFCTFLLSLSSKPMMVTLPFLLLALDYWPFRRFEDASDIPSSLLSFKSTLYFKMYEKVPFILLSGLFSWIAFYAQSKSGAVSSISKLSFLSRINNTIVAYATYLVKVFYPEKLAVIYPLRASIPTWEILFSAMLLIGITFFVSFRVKSNPYLLIGWGWYLGTLLPVIGIVQIGSASMADKFTYIPIIGIFIMIAWGLNDFIDALKYKYKHIMLAIAATIIVVSLFTRSWLYLECWEDSISLYKKALEVTENNYIVLNNLGVALTKQGNDEEALGYFLESIRVKPDFEHPYCNIGSIYYRKHDVYKALYYYNKALMLNPNFQEAQQGIEICNRTIKILNLPKSHEAKAGITYWDCNLKSAYYRN